MSEIVLLTDEAYQAGLARMQAEVGQVKARGAQIVFRIHIITRMCHGFKPV